MDHQLATNCCTPTTHHHLLLLLLLLRLLLLLPGSEYPLLDNLSLGVDNVLHDLSLGSGTRILLYHLTAGLLLYHVLLLLLDDLCLLCWMNDLLDDLAAGLLDNLTLGHHNLLTRLDTNWTLMLVNTGTTSSVLLLLLLASLLLWRLPTAARGRLLLTARLLREDWSGLSTAGLLGRGGLGRRQSQREWLCSDLDAGVVVLGPLPHLLLVGARAAPKKRPNAEGIVLG